MKIYITFLNSLKVKWHEFFLKLNFKIMKLVISNFIFAINEWKEEEERQL